MEYQFGYRGGSKVLTFQALLESKNAPDHLIRRGASYDLYSRFR